MNYKHGKWKSLTYRTWRAMMTRCTDPSSEQFARYGGRGITVCARWSDPVNGFLNFFADMGERSKGQTIDRIDNDGNYEPGNVRWADKWTQASNRRTSRMLEFGGERLHVAEWARRLGVGRDCILHRLTRGWSIERAVTTPSLNPQDEKRCSHE